MNPLRVAIIGAGHLGRIHTRLLQTQEDVAVVGVVDPIPEMRERIAADFQVPTFDHHDALHERIDCAIVATTTEFHHSVGCDLLRRGCHLFIETPTIGKLSSMYLYAWEKGLKTTYYLRSRPATRIRQATVSSETSFTPVARPGAAPNGAPANPEICEACQ